MAPQQRTFTIVPNPLGMQGLVQRPAGEGVPAHRPMTSKQAQKLHRQATRLPKRTKAEQAKYEAEQRRLIKEEDEKRRASNKARILREKKKEKEQKVIEAKKRKGLPIVDVRPSQDLITRFVRGNGTGKKRDVAEAALDPVREESPACDSATETAADEDVYHPAEEEPEKHSHADAPIDSPGRSSNPAKRLRIQPGGAGNPSSRASRSPRNSQRAGRTAVSALRLLDARSRESSLDVDDPAVEDLLRTQMLEDSISAASSSALQQRSPCQNTKVAFVSEAAPGKENIPPGLTATNASEPVLDKSPAKPAQVQQPLQYKSPQHATSRTHNGISGSPLSRVVVGPKESLVREPASESPTKRSPQKSPDALPSIQRHNIRHTTANVRKPSRYESDLMESVRPCSPTAPTTGPQAVNRAEYQQNCPNPCVSRLQAMPAGATALPASERPHPSTTVEPKRLQETSGNIPRAAVNGPGTFVAAKPLPRANSAPHAPHPAGKQSMPPPPPPSSRFKRPSQESHKPKFLPTHQQTPVSHPALPQPSHIRTPGVAGMASEFTLPTSTQLFVLSHLDEILPSPSQELRELGETAPRPPPISRPKPLAWKPPPRFPARGVYTTHRATPPPPPQFKAPQRTSAAPMVFPIQQAMEPTLPFFSTQDLMLSSQDIRDLEDTIETPSKLPNKEAQGKKSHVATASAWKETPSKAGHSADDAFIYPRKNKRAGQDRAQHDARIGQQQSASANEHRQCSQFSQAPRYALRNSQPRTPVCSSGLAGRASQPPQPPSQVGCLDPVRSNPSLSHVAAASQRSARSSPQPAHLHDGRAEPPVAAPPKPSSSGRKTTHPSPATEVETQPTAKRNSQAPQAAHGTSAKPETPTPSAPAQKGRFFTASNEAIQLAMEKSMRTHREEQRKREAEQRALELRRLEEEASHAREEEDGEEEEDEYDYELPSTQKIEEALLQCEQEEYEREVLADWNAEHQYDADGQAAEEARDAADVDMDTFDLEPDLEIELLKAEYDVAEVMPPAPALSGDVHGGLKEEPKAWVASQETDYGDLDVTAEDLDDYL